MRREKQRRQMRLNIEGRTRKDILNAALSAGKTGAHIAPSLSLVEIALAVIEEMKDGDQFILSKGHGALGYYAAMHQSGKITDEQFSSFEQNGGEFPGQPSKSVNNGITYSSGSLGMGLSYAAGLAYAEAEHHFFVILGDGELNEGSVWEAAGLIKQHGLSNVTAIVDRNGLQSDGETYKIFEMDLYAIWQGYGWNILSCNGHLAEELKQSIMRAKENTDAPTVILAETTKGKGVSFMENNNGWHHHELTREDYDLAIKEIGERYGLCEK